MWIYLVIGLCWGIYATHRQTVVHSESSGCDRLLAWVVNSIFWPVAMVIAFRTWKKRK